MQTNRIRELREQRKLTQAELGRLLQVDETAVSRWESGSRALTPTVLGRLAKIFKCETWELLVDRDGLRRLARVSVEEQAGVDDEQEGRP